MLEKNVEKREALWTAGGNGNWGHHYGEKHGNALKIKKKKNVQFSNSTSGYISDRNEGTISKRLSASPMFTERIHNSQDIETT